MPNQILLVDKPVGFSSFQIVRVLKRAYGKVGHAGTLDPFASGLLIILIGLATKKFTEIEKNAKEYIGEMFLGIVTDTYDISGTRLGKSEAGNHRQEQMNRTDCSIDGLNSTACSFVGEIEQVPPRFSAIKRNGKKFYELSRKGLSVQPEKRKVFIKSFHITACNYPIVQFSTVVGKGTYVRSLVYDFGHRLGCGATLLTLRRTRIGEYSVTDAQRLGDIIKS